MSFHNFEDLADSICKAQMSIMQKVDSRISSHPDEGLALLNGICSLIGSYVASTYTFENEGSAILDTLIESMKRSFIATNRIMALDGLQPIETFAVYLGDL